MKKLFLLILLSFFITTSTVSAQMMGGRFFGAISDDHTKKEEAEGREIWEKLENKKINCQKLTEDQFEALGEYFMGKMAGESHAAMNQMMTRMMGEKGERQMHIVLGKRMSGCDKEANPPQGWGWMMPMMGGWFMGWYWLTVKILILLILVLLVVYLFKKVKSSK